MNLTEDFTTQANIGRAIAYEMSKHPEYRNLLEARLPEMADKGQAESLRIKLRILLEMLGEPTDNWISVEDRLPEENQKCIAVFSTLYIGGAATDVAYTIYHCNGRFSNAIDRTKVTHWQPLPQPPKKMI